LALALPFACDRQSDPQDDASDLADATSEAEAALGAPAVGELALAPEGVGAVHKPNPRPVMKGSKAAFDEMVALIGKHYVDGGLSEDELWTGAMEGVLGRLVQHPQHPINVLLPPTELKELFIGTKGKLVGVGVQISTVADVVVINAVVPDSPAEKAGLLAGDRILGVDGERIRGADLASVVEKIRGEDGTPVDLFVQRDTDEWNQTITRGAVQFLSVESTMIGTIGYLRISSFSERTAAELDAHLTEMSSRGMTGLVLDLRMCPGGLLETSVDVAGRFMPKGTRVLSVVGRDGETKSFDIEWAYQWTGLPMAVLVGPKTASSAEVLASALSEHDRAPTIGEATMGKGTVESIHEIGEGWAVKLTQARILSPNGEGRHEHGLRPDVAIPNPETIAAVSQLDPATDPPLAAAIDLVAR
jgi:carboxyl-terminal processing protease